MSDEAFVLCEGYHDRAFLTGALLRLGWPAPVSGTRVDDPWGDRVDRGHFGFYRDSRFVRIVPASGDETKLIPAAGTRLKMRATRPLRALVLCLDSDTDDRAGLDLRRAQLASFAADHGAKPSPPGDSFILGDLPVHLVVWRAPDDGGVAGVPATNTLEKLVCTALTRAKPDYAAAVDAFLASEPTGPRPGPKEHAWSFMAKWYANHNCDDFYKLIWRDEAIATELEQLLEELGIWAVFKSL